MGAVREGSFQGIASQLAEKVGDRAESIPQALKRVHIFSGLAARVELVPFPFQKTIEFFRNLFSDGTKSSEMQTVAAELVGGPATKAERFGIFERHA